MRKAHILWLGGTTVAIGSLLMTLHTRPERRDRTTPRHDEPGAAARSDLARRQPADRRLDMPRLYEAATRRVASLARFSSAIGRDIPAAQPASRVWLSGSRAMALRDGNSATGVLDAWTPLGPGNIGGRTRVVKFHPTIPTTLFAAGVSGGVWKSDDNATTWRPTGDGLTNIAINSLLIDPARPDVMYAGTGEGYFREEIRGTGLPLRGNGIYVTTDAARSWRQLPATNTPDFHWVNDLEFGVNDSRRIYAATRSGVWRSTDGGATWAQLLAVDVRGGCLDLALRPDRSDDVLFASCGSYEQATVYRFPRAADRSDVEVVLREPDMGRTSLAIAPSNPDVIYALAASNAPGLNGIYEQGLLAVYRSDRGGVAGSWEARVTNNDPTFLNTMLLTNVSSAAARVCSAQGSTAIPGTMGWYNNVIAVDPRDPNRVWAAGVEWFRSDDGGRNWGLASYGYGGAGSFYAHSDQHAITFHPNYDGDGNQIALIGNDGGIYRTTNARAATSNGSQAACTGGQPIQVAWTTLNRGYGVTQFYHGTPFPDGTQYLAGAQDNNTLLGSDAAGPDGWKPVFGGDGGFSAVHPTQTSVWLMEYQWASLGRTINGGLNISQSRAGLDPIFADNLGPQGNYLFIAPFTHDPVSNAIWLGGEFLYQGPNFGQGWSKVLSSRAPEGGRISAIAISPSGSTVFSGTDRGHILRTTNATQPVSAMTFTTTQPRQGWVTSIAIDPTSGAVYATYGNFGGAHIFRSIDHGETWQSLDGSGPTGFPDIPAHSIVVDPDDPQRLYLGTDLGVMVSIDGGATWMAEETGFGPAVTMWLSLIRTPGGQKQLFAFTHGRGAWRVTLR